MIMNLNDLNNIKQNKQPYDLLDSTTAKVSWSFTISISPPKWLKPLHTMLEWDI